MKRVEVRLDDRTLGLIHDYMDVKEIKTVTMAVKQLVALGVQSLGNKELAEFSKELRELKREVAGTNERIDLMMKLDQGPNKGN